MYFSLAVDFSENALQMDATPMQPDISGAIIYDLHSPPNSIVGPNACGNASHRGQGNAGHSV
jgi:hypothetical protein